ncbi:Protein of unknown function [Propionibacterium freudenreichii subsp. freudenreichii]
MVSKK